MKNFSPASSLSPWALQLVTSTPNRVWDGILGLRAGEKERSLSLSSSAGAARALRSRARLGIVFGAAGARGGSADPMCCDR